jgi:hypothetical protein
MDEPLTRERETGRQRALRIPLAYHRSRGTIWTWKVLFSLAGFIIGGLYIGWVLAGGKSAATQVSPGILAHNHARWDSDCRACHMPFVPQRPDAVGTRMLSLSLAGNATKDLHQQTDARCSECHKSAGAHHVNQISADVESCASCHRDHQGRDFDMAHMDDAQCTGCHASIASHSNSPSKSPIANVTAFEVPSAADGTGHPTFRSLQIKEDPGNIRFSHRLHMTPGQLYPGQKLPPGKELVQLTCDVCHQDSPAPLGGGAYMQPINFARHCQSCHPLQTPGKAEAIPHGLKAEQLETVVAGLLVDEESRPAILQRLIPGKARPKQGKQDDLHPPRALIAASHLQQLRANSCSKCHSWQPEKPEVVPASIPVVWLKGARFNHAAHSSAAKCQDCHPQASESASGGQPGNLADDERVMIPDIDNCARCHAPKNDSAGHGGARYDCAECHRYHTNPEKPLPAAFAVSQTMEKLRSPPTREKAAHDFVGTQSCSAAGCHGAAKGADSTSSFSRFTAADPHTGAFLLLYTPASLEIYRRLTNQPQAMLEGAAYLRFTQEKCVGCHATPLADPIAANLIENQAGVTCESCHGAAAKWEFTHFDRANKTASLPIDLTNPSLSAAVCAQCHIGPQSIAGKSFDVNHDLIAAGHPRLTFEFEAQLANLPAHWSAAKEIKSHFDAWRAGELATAAQQDKLYSGRAAHEFASHRCFDCHHGLTAKPAAARVSFPPLAVISKEQRALLAGPAPSKQEQAGLLLKLLSSATDEQITASPGTQWEEYVRFSLALSAYAADNPQRGDLANHANDLQGILTNSFRSLPTDRKMTAEPFFAGGPYDSPTGFDHHDERLQKVLENIRASLNSP